MKNKLELAQDCAGIILCGILFIIALIIILA